MSALLTALTTGSLATTIAPYLASGNDVAIFNIVHDRSLFTRLDWISVADFNTWCSLHNAEYVNIESLAANSASPYFSSAKALLRCLLGSINSGAINLGSPTVLSMLNAWPYIDVTGASKNSLMAYGTFPASFSDLNPGIDFGVEAIAVARLGG